MRFMWFTAIAAACLAACANQAARQPVELLDATTGMTVTALPRPLEFVEHGLMGSGKRTSFAYLGPVEWDRMGHFTDGLWLHVAPGTDKQVGDIRAAGAVTLLLDDGPLVLSPIDAPPLGKEPYAPLVSWGQTGYFGMSRESLERLAMSSRVVLRLHGADDADVDFDAGADVHAALTDYLNSR